MFGPSWSTSTVELQVLIEGTISYFTGNDLLDRLMREKEGVELWCSSWGATGISEDTGYPHDGQADTPLIGTTVMRYMHNREIDIQMLNVYQNGYIFS